ncbi:Ubiquitin carboxyl-terminal hydrolase [Aphelenchoides fujianensis]|nr:Ubiquitin carboxyl-terminal hydrolase [Aphelenchoides fujianensis]
MPQVTVKWNAEKLDVDADVNEEPLVFKSQLFALTGVPPDRQKVMFKGKTLKDDTWTGFPVQEGSQLMMLGSSTALPQAKMDATPSSTSNNQQLDENGEEVVKLPSGLQNLGNTCYMNSTLQSFMVIPELVQGISKWTTAGSQKMRGELQKAYSGSIHTLFKDLTAGERESYMPLLQVTLMHKLYPQFATRSQQGGGWEQQDANECFCELLREFSEASEVEVKDEKGETKAIPVRRFLEGEYEIQMKNTENPEEPPQLSKENFLQLSCFLSQETRYLQSGIKSKLSEEIEKHSESLGKNCKYLKEAKISRLPAHLTIQMVRFFYKEKDQVNAKIMKDVKFPMILDMCDCCTPELQNKLRPQRVAWKEYEDAMLEEQRAAKLTEGKAEKKKKEAVEYVPSSFADDPGSNNSGFYQLNAVITHKGRSSNSGHYVAWVRIQDDKWCMCDDEATFPVTEEQVLKLSGGGDWHTAYVLVYGPRRLPILKK